jgi:NitT/TauT family transport system ATP-binding protein
MNDTPQILAARDIEVTFRSRQGNVTALDHFEAVMAEGEFLAVLGPSGCGKSTLLRLISGLIVPSRGAVALRGTPITGPRPDVGMVFQQATLLPWRNVTDNVLLPIETLKRDMRHGRETAERLIRLVGLEKFARHYPHELSGGMQQRVGIARGLVHDPGLLLMDEPFAALDAMTREHMMIELQRIWVATAKSIVFITHSIPEAVFLADRILVLSARPGRVISDIRVDIPRPRTLDAMSSPFFGELCRELRSLFVAADVTGER